MMGVTWGGGTGRRQPPSWDEMFLFLLLIAVLSIVIGVVEWVWFTPS